MNDNNPKRDIRMERFFNTAGPQIPADHYTVDLLHRINLDEIMTLVHRKQYFVLHAPRQTGKTSCMLALRDYLNGQGDYIAVYANVEGGQGARGDVRSTVATVCGTIAEEMSLVIGTNEPQEIRKTVRDDDPNEMLTTFLKRLCMSQPKPLVLILDEIDALVGDGLVSVLRQIRSGYANRPKAFPLSIALCGVRDVRDYRIVLSNQDIITGGSAFNIKAESVRLGNFSKEEIHALYMQHTQETGQQWDEACFPMVWEATEGQPWLVNALANEVTYKMKENRDRSVTITPDMLYRAQEQIIYRRDTHIDILIDKLKEPRVKRVVEPILANSDEADESRMTDDDIQYVKDMGLVVKERGMPLRISNAIYREIIPRELTASTQQQMLQQPQWYENADGSINMEKLLTDFQQFFRQNADSWIGKFDYAEAGPQLLLQAYLQRVVNGGGYIDREYGLGRKRTDLLIRKPLGRGYGVPVQRIVLELKIKRGSLDAVIGKGLRQTWEYMDMAGSVDEGHLIIFDRDGQRSWDERIWSHRGEYRGHPIMVWGM